MKNLSGYLTARLAQRDEHYENQLIEEINRRINPPRPVGTGDVYIRAMYIVSDQVNSQGGRFAEEELERLTVLLVDSPVMVGHQRDSLPLARNFLAQKVEIDGRVWVKSYFYWMKESEGAEDLKNNIDGGIYKECSVSFLFTLPECSICGKDIRECHHLPFHEYEIESGRREIAHFKYRNIEKVLETSLVFRGAVPDTRITDKLSPDDGNPRDSRRPLMVTHFFKVCDTPARGSDNHHYGRARLRFMPASDYRPLNSSISLYVAPYQPGLEIQIYKNAGNIKIDTAHPLPDEIRQYITDCFSTIKCEAFTLDAVLYAVKGKQRLNGSGLMRAISSLDNLHRLRIKICDATDLNGDQLCDTIYKDRIDRINRVLADLLSGNIEIKRFRFIGVEDWQGESIADECARHNFGLEVLEEKADGVLTRYIVTPDRLIPAVIDKIRSRNRGRLFCDLTPFDHDTEVSGIICRPMAGLEPGAIVLITGKKLAGGKPGQAGQLYDILPGTKSCRIYINQDLTSADDLNLHIVRDGTRLRLFFPESNHRRAILLYHYSTTLFNRGRRFIGDMLPEDYRFMSSPAGTTLPLESVTCSKNLFLLRLKEASPVFGDKMELWLRPAMIDGRERYLFYGGGINCHPEDL